MQNKLLKILYRRFFTKVSAIILCLFLLFCSLTFLQTPYLKIQYAAADSWSFITRSGSTLQNNGTPFKFAGANIHWLGLADSVHGVVAAYPSQFMIDDALTTAQEMGMTGVRSHTLGASVGCANCIEPSLNQWNGTAFNTIDYAIQSAHTHGLRLIIPLVDNWHFYEGGKHTFTDWENDSNEDNFFTNATVIQDFENYISHVLNHVNQYTGIALKDDPTIMAWETGNELNTTSTTWGSTQDSWTQTIATYIKSIAPNQLVADGHTAESNSNTQLSSNQLQLSAVDLYTDHFYPPNISTMQTNANLAVQNNKVYYVGEYDWTDKDHTPAAGSISQDSTTSSSGTYSALINITKQAISSTYYYYVQLEQGSFALNSGDQYTISFYAKASDNNIVQATLQQSGFPFATYTTKNFTLNSSWNQYSFTYTPSQTYSSVSIRFNLAANTGNIWLDNISVASGTSGNLITNNSFENTGSNWLSPWVFQVKSSLGDSFANFIPAVETTTGVSGDLFWDLYNHDDIHGYDSNDRYTFHYPGDTADYRSRAQTLRTHAYTMSSKTAPLHIVPSAPLLNSVTTSGNSVSVDWRGAAAAASYNVLKTTDNGITWQTIKSGLTDVTVPDTASTNGTGSYKLVPLSLDGLLGAESNIVPPLATPSATTASASAIPTVVPISLPAFSSYIPAKLPITPNPNTTNTIEQNDTNTNLSDLQPLPLEVNQHIYSRKELLIKIITPDGSAIKGITLTQPSSKQHQTTDDTGHALFKNILPGDYTFLLAYKNLSGNIAVSVPENPYIKSREVTIVLSVENKLSAAKLSSLLKNLFSFHKQHINV